MFFKKCPFCNKEINVVYDLQNDIYTLQCDNCKKNGLFIEIKNKDKSQIQKIWNFRKTDELLCAHPNEYIDALLKLKNNDLNILKDEINIFKEYSPLDLNKIDYGYLIFKNLDVIYCKDSHPEELLKYLNLEKEDGKFDCDSLCLELNIIRISSYENCCMISIPKFCSKNQIKKASETLLNSKYRFLKLFCIYYLENVETFNNFNDFLIYLEDLK